ncbi:AI-2E family transporter [Methanocaldococcus sp. 10A]
MRFSEFRFLRKGVIIGLLIMLLYIVLPFIDVLAYSIAFAYMALPIYKLLRKKFNKTISAGLAISIYLIPIILITTYTLFVVMDIIFSFNTNSLEQYIENIKLIFNIFNYGILNGLINEQIILKYAEEFVKYLINQFSGKVVDIGYLIVKVIMILFITFYFLKDGDKVKNLLISLSPNEDKEKMRIYLEYLHDSYKNLFISCVSLSVIIAILSYIGYLIVGIPYAELFAIITGIFALLPILGGWMVYIPIAIYYFLTHDYTKAIFMFIYGEIFLSIAPDFVIRPYLVKKDVDIHPVLVVIAFLMAPLSLGFSGFAIGPLVVGALNAFYLAKYRDGKI